MGLSLPHLVILALVVLVLFGRGRISEMMGDFGKGIKSFKEGMTEEVKPGAAAVPPAQQIPPPSPTGQATLNGETTIDSSSTKPQQ
ncbi:MAG: twin-arginine translocase TatA/TatE family subunit [Novosphingobium sp.]